MVDIDSIKYELNEYVGEFLERSGNGRGYVCPFCGNGSGRDGTGLELKSEARLWACYGGCGGKKYNAVQLLMESEHLDGFGDASRRACETRSGFPPMRVVPPCTSVLCLSVPVLR